MSRRESGTTPVDSWQHQRSGGGKPSALSQTAVTAQPRRSSLPTRLRRGVQAGRKRDPAADEHPNSKDRQASEPRPRIARGGGRTAGVMCYISHGDSVAVVTRGARLKRQPRHLLAPSSTDRVSVIARGRRVRLASSDTDELLGIAPLPEVPGLERSPLSLRRYAGGRLELAASAIRCFRLGGGCVPRLDALGRHPQPREPEDLSLDRRLVVVWRALQALLPHSYLGDSGAAIIPLVWSVWRSLRGNFTWRAHQIRINI
jgi:hypothetical protein